LTSSDTRRVRRALDGDRTVTVTRAFPLDDIRIQSRGEGGDGRTVTAYAAVFLQPTEILDQDGHYTEQLDPASFHKTLQQRRKQVFCVYNHAKSLGGMPSDMWSVPIGVPVDMRSDQRGLLTVTRYNPDPASDRILEAIKSESLTGMSFTGVFLRSDPELQGPWSEYGPNRLGELPLVTRLEIALIEYGPTPIPAYDDAMIVGVRSHADQEAREVIHVLTPDTIRSLGAGNTPHLTPPGPGPGGTIHPGIRATPVHTSVPLVTPDDPEAAKWDSQQAEHAMIFPADLAHMHSLYALYDTSGEFADGTFPASAGQLPHHLVNHDGQPGPAHPDAVHAALDALPALPIDDAARTAARKHLEGHLDTKPAAAEGATNGSGTGTLASEVTSSSSGRDEGGGEHERAETTGPAAGTGHGDEPGDEPGTVDDSGTNGSSSSSGRQPATQDPSERAGESAEGTGPPSPEETPAAPPDTHPAPPDMSSGSVRMDGPMKVAERQARLTVIQGRMKVLHALAPDGDLPAEFTAEWGALSEEMGRHDTAIKDAAERSRMVAAFTTPEGTPDGDATEGAGNAAGFTGGVPGQDTEGGGGQSRFAGRNLIRRSDRTMEFYDPQHITLQSRNAQHARVALRDRAMQVIEEGSFPSRVQHTRPEDGRMALLSREDCQNRVAMLLENLHDPDGAFARRVIATGNPVYEEAFGHALARQNVAGLGAEQMRALELGIDPYGGYAVPYQLDPTIILTSNGAINPIRQLARVETITGKEWDGVTSAGIVVSRALEGAEAGTGDAQLTQPTVRTTRVQGFVPFSVELDVSWGALRSQMTSLLMDAKDIEEASSFILGNGVAPNPNGLVYAISSANASVGTASTVYTAGTAALAVSDLYTMENVMPPRFRQQSAYLGSRTVYNKFRQLFQALASAAFDSWVRPSQGQPATFNGYPAYEVSTMSGTITSGQLILVQGDYRQYLIVDRVGMGIELIPHLFGAANRYPIGERGILAIWFNNAQVLVPNAFRLLEVT
jgi:HK97 family phage major capsid protein/HK97 family phage prohead protease